MKKGNSYLMVTVTSRILSVVMRPVMRWRTAVRVRIPGAELWRQQGLIVSRGEGQGYSRNRGRGGACGLRVVSVELLLKLVAGARGDLVNTCIERHLLH